MSSSASTFATTAVSAALFTYLISNRKFKFAATWLLIGECLQQLSKKEKTIHAIGTNILAGSIFALPGLCMGNALYQCGDKTFSDLAFSILMGILSGGHVYGCIQMRATNKEASSLVHALHSTQYYINKAISLK